MNNIKKTNNSIIYSVQKCNTHNSEKFLIYLRDNNYDIIDQKNFYKFIKKISQHAFQNIKGYQNLIKWTELINLIKLHDSHESNKIKMNKKSFISLFTLTNIIKKSSTSSKLSETYNDSKAIHCTDEHNKRDFVCTLEPINPNIIKLLKLKLINGNEPTIAKERENESFDISTYTVYDPKKLIDQFEINELYTLCKNNTHHNNNLYYVKSFINKYYALLDSNIINNAFDEACESLHIDIIELILLEFKPLIKLRKNKHCKTPFDNACQQINKYPSKQFNLIKLLTKEFKNYVKFEIDNNGYNAFDYVCMANNNEVILYLLHEYRDVIKNFDNAFIYTCQNGNLEVATILIELYDLGIIRLELIKNKQGYTALDLACKNGYYDIVELILSFFNKNSKINLNNPIKLASAYGHFKIIELLFRTAYIDGSKLVCDAFNWSCIQGYIDIIKLIIKNYKNDIISNFNLNANDDLNFVHIGFNSACAYGHIDIVELLLSEFSENIQLYKNNYDDSAFDLACKFNHYNIIKLLYEHYTIDEINCSNFGIICCSGNINIVEFIINKFNRQLIEDRKGLSIFNAFSQVLYSILDSSSVGAPSIYSFLEDFNMNNLDTFISSVTHEFNTKSCYYNFNYPFPVHKNYNSIGNDCDEYINNLYSIAKLLMNEFKPTIELYSDRLCNKFADACKKGNLEIVKLLYINFTGKINFCTEKNNEGYTIMEEACKAGYFDIVAYLLQNIDIIQDLDILLKDDNDDHIGHIDHTDQGLDILLKNNQNRKNDDNI
jgi:ankyrin repeat protein